MSEPTPVPRGQLRKLHSWSPGTAFDEQAWRRRRRCHIRRRLRRAQSGVTDDDVDELRAWFELGFKFDSPNIDLKLERTFPALEIARSVSMSAAGAADGGVAKPLDLGEDPKVVKARLKQWAQVVACIAQQKTNSQVEIGSSSN